jgi:hypothetical protein
MKCNHDITTTNYSIKQNLLQTPISNCRQFLIICGYLIMGERHQRIKHHVIFMKLVNFSVLLCPHGKVQPHFQSIESSEMKSERKL